MLQELINALAEIDTKQMNRKENRRKVVEWADGLQNCKEHRKRRESRIVYLEVDSSNAESSLGLYTTFKCAGESHFAGSEFEPCIILQYTARGKPRQDLSADESPNLHALELHPEKQKQTTQKN